MMSDKMTLRTRWQSSRRLRWGTWAVGATALFAVLGFLVLPPIVRHVAVDKLSEALHRPVNIDRVAINPFTLTLEVENLNIGEREGETSFAGFERLRVNLQASSLFRGGPVIDEIRLVGPWFHLARLDAERYNFSDLLDIFGAPPEKAADAATPAFSLNNIFISDGTVEFDDRVIGGEKHRAENITLALPFVSNMDYATEIFIEPHFSAVVDGARLEAEAHSKPFSESRESEFLLRLNDVRLPAYFAYLPLDLPMALESGALDTDLKLAFSQESGELPRLTLSGMASVRDLKITGSAGRDLAAFRRLDVAIASADPIGGRLVIDRVTLDSPEITARVGPKGRLDWLDLLPSATDADGPEEAVLKEWSLGEAQISGGTLRWHDASNSPAFTAKIGAIDARVKNLDG
ncbi:MAG: DUF748 domain-containing protein, partial [Candidatus Accumulibacter sp.]|nr:DUF748 domain-containing protein [Accumulibacter sp.]